jgi:ABC-type transport system involved in cytochrome bd biosynthesis fused ATPase/permease subunit
MAEVNMEAKHSYEEMKASLAAQSLEEIRATPAWKKIQQIFELTELHRESIKDNLRTHYPNAEEEEIGRRFAVVWLGAELTKKAYGWEVSGDDSDLLVW